MSTGGNKTIRFVNTLAGEGNNQLEVLDRGQIIAPQPTPGAISSCSSDPDNTICGFGAGLGITTATGNTIFGNDAGAKYNRNDGVFIGKMQD